MKYVRIPLLVLFFCISIMTAYSQDATTGDTSGNTGTSGIQSDAGTGDVKAASDTGTADKTSGTVKEKKQAEKKQVEKKSAVNREKEVVNTSSAGDVSSAAGGSSDVRLLQINEGNYKYKRIPDIKLPENPVPVAENVQGDNTAVQDTGSGGGFLGMSKTASDIIVYGGIIVFIYIIFFLSRSRMKGSGGRKSNRKVLNSYRK